MPERAATGGLTYALPDNRYIAPSAALEAPEQGATPFFSIPKVGDDLDYVEGLTDRFYNLRGKVEAYATDMWKRYGVDVTQPDYSQPDNGGGIPFKTYQKLATDLLMTANDLKTSMQMKKAEAPYRMSGAIQDVEGGVDPSVPINRVSANERYFSTKLLPEVEAANAILKENVYTDADYKRFKEQVLDPTVAKLEAEMEREGITAAEKQKLQFNIDALKQKPKTTPYAAFQTYGRGNKSTIEIDLAKKVTNLANGKWAPGSYTPATDNKGNPILINKAMEGEQAGEHVYEDAKGNQKRVPRVLDGLMKKADGIYFTFKQQEGVEIPPVKVSGKAGDEITASIIASNPKYGSVTKMYEALREMNLADETGSLMNDKVLAGAEFDTPDPAAFGLGIEAEKERIRQELKKTTEGGFQVSRKTFSVSLPDGGTITFKPNRVGTGWFVSAGGESSDNMSEQDVINLLAEQKYFDQFLTKTPGVTPKDEALGQLSSGLVTVPELPAQANETQAQYDLRLIKFRRSQKK